MEAIEIALLAAEPLDRMGVRWLIGGSVASSLYGVPRATLDVDLVADLQPRHVPELVRLWSENFLADEEMIRGAVGARRSCNLIHLESALKVDIFVAGPDPWIQQEFDNIHLVAVPTLAGAVRLPFARAEDVLLHKLKWFLDGDRISDRQWGDILGLVRTRGATLDRAHLHKWADHLTIPPDVLVAALEGRPKP